MNPNHSPRKMPARVTAAIVACLLALAPQTAMAQNADASPSAGILQASTGLYAFTPSTCAIHMEDGIPDIEVQGPGKAPDGENFYFDFSSTANELTSELGVDEPYESTDRKLKAGQFVSSAFEVDVSDGIISVASLDLVDELGQSVDPKASLRIDCTN